MTTQLLEQSLEILVDELVTDDELRDAFLRNPLTTLRSASEWGMPLTDSELQVLCAGRFPVWERVAEELGARLGRVA